MLHLSSLEILDISKNKLRVLPDRIASLSSLKVLAVSKNRIERLPLCLGDMGSLRVLKLDGNPLAFPPADVYTIKDDAPSPANDNDREVAVTAQVKKYLRQISTQNSNRQRLQVESEGESRCDWTIDIDGIEVTTLTVVAVKQMWRQLHVHRDGLSLDASP